MKPTIGRIVHVYSSNMGYITVPRPAIITAVTDDGQSIYATIFSPDAAPYLGRGIPPRTGDTGEGWVWPPRD